MSLLQKHLPFVKEQIEFQQRMIEKFSDNTFRQSLHKTTQEKFRALAADLELADKLLGESTGPTVSTSGPVRLALLPHEIEGLPDEVLKELSISSDADKTEFTILSLIEEAGGIITLDRLIIGLFRKTGETHQRQAVTSKLYRMAQKHLIYNVPTKKGVYSIKPISEEEAVKLFSGESPESN